MSREFERISAEGSPTIYRIIDGERNGDVHANLIKKLVNRQELPELGEFLRRRGLKIAFTSGTYDMIHVGHGRYLQLARSLGDTLVLGLNSDVFMKKM